MIDPTILALQRLCEREGGYKIVAAVIGANDQSIYQVISGVKTKAGNPKGVGQSIRKKLERHYPGWMLLSATVASEIPANYRIVDVITGQTITPGNTGSSHAMRLGKPTMPPPRIDWDALMDQPLPPEFETELPDNAMSPQAPKGSRVIFITGVTAEPGDWILLTDREGSVCCREYRLSRPGHWEAHAINSAVLPMESERDGLIILAVYDGMRGRRAPK